MSQYRSVVQRICTARKAIFLVGAGISKRSPSSLPLGFELSAGLVEASAGSGFAEELRELYGNFEDIGLPRGFPRPETILEVLYPMGGAEVLGCLAFMAQVPPNPNHYSLAALVGRGATVFTTNFDVLLEAATDEIGCQDSAQARIRHLHGRMDDPASLRATMAGITRPLEKPEAGRLQKAIAEADVVVAAGYSASDMFDITPVLREAFLEARGELVWLQHRAIPDESVPSDRVERVPPQVEDLLKLWPGPRRLLTAPTDEVFDALLEVMGFRPLEREVSTSSWEERLGPLMREALDRSGGRQLVRVAFADLVGCGKLAMDHGRAVDCSGLETIRQRLLCRRYLRSGLRITGQYGHAVRQSIGSAALALGGLFLRRLSPLDLAEELYAVNYEWRVYGQRDPCVAVASTLYLLVPSTLLRIYLLAAPERQRHAERVQVLRYRDGAYWAFMWWLLTKACKEGAEVGSRRFLGRIGGAVLPSIAQFCDRQRERVSRRVRPWRVWLPDDRVTFLMTLPEGSEELNLLTGELEQLLASVNRVRSLKEEELDRVQQEKQSRRALSALEQDVRKLRLACKALGDVPGELKATVLLARGSELVGDREEALAGKREAETLLDQIRWSRGARRYWLWQIRHDLSASRSGH